MFKPTYYVKVRSEDQDPNYGHDGGFPQVAVHSRLSGASEPLP